MIITIEGNIGAGKTSFAESLYLKMKHAGRNVLYVPEPVESWKNVGGDNLLDMYYRDRKRWSFLFQVNALLEMSECDKQASTYSTNGCTVIRERSSYTVRNIFIPIVSEHLSAAEKHVLNELCVTPHNLIGTNRNSDLTVYLRTEPETCYRRVNERGRSEEINGRVDLTYLRKLHELHEGRSFDKFGSDRLIIADGNSFDVSDPTSIKILEGGDDLVIDILLISDKQ